MQPTTHPFFYTNYITELLKRGMRYTAKQFRADFASDDICLEAIFQARYGHMRDCPRCGVINTKFYRIAGRKCYACMHCRYQLYPLAQTIFNKSTTPLTDWFYAIYLFLVARNGVAAKELERHLGVTYKTAHRMGHQVRRLMELTDKIGGPHITVEADETYYGGRRRYWRGPRGKAPVLGVVERGGEVRAVVSDVASTRRSKAFLHTAMRFESILHTDESSIYRWTDKHGIQHDSVNHAMHEYARGQVTTNTIEGFWSQLKRSIDGTYHCVSRKYLQLYVNEFTWRYSRRGEVMYPSLLERAAIPFT